MAQCPRCGESIEQDFGMVTCPSCSTILFVDYDGNLQASADRPAENVADELAESVVESFVETTSENIPESFPENFQDSSEQTPLSDPIGKDLQPVSEFEAPENGFGFSDPPEAMAEVLQEVVNFGNADLDEGHALQYSLAIESIDSKEVRDQVFLILADVRLGLNVRELQAKLKDGRLELGALNPVRTSVIVSRLRELAVRLRWTQGVWKGE